jgi:crotonobetainyl-CoA:carnitine CoA-transferase CaiB-like acyl-CoA transferase
VTGLPPLPSSYRVVDLSEGIAGAYCTKLLADAGAEVIKVEPPDGSALWRRSASGAPIDARYGGVLYQYLSCSKQSVVVDVDVDLDVDLVRTLVRSADAIVWSHEGTICSSAAFAVDDLRRFAPHAAVLALTPFGLTSPWAGRPANEFLLQAMSGSAWNHGPPGGTPLMVGASHGDYAHGTVGALGLLIARERIRRSGRGEVVDVAGLEVLQLTHSMFPITFLDLAGRPYRAGRMDPIPGIHRTKDGWVGYWVTTGQQWLDFCTMLERFDWLEDSSLGLMDNRALRHDELVGVIDDWSAQRTTDDIVEFAAALRLPIAPIGNGETLPTFDQYVERRCFTAHPRSGAVQPDVPYTLSGGAERRAFEPSPALGEHTELHRGAATSPHEPASEGPTGEDAARPFDGIRVVDMTAFWAGPIISHVLSMLGADVIHIEAAGRPDGIRMASAIPFGEPGWWETSPFFNGTNTTKRDLAVDLQTERGRELLLELIAKSDILIENYSPRVMGQLGLDYETLREINPALIMVRAPAFGITGPWRDRVGYAPTIDQASGLSWITGTPDGPPSMVGAASDAVGGMHGTLAILMALEHRRRSGRGMLIESPQVGPALNLAGEQVAEYSVNGALLGRTGNRSWVVAPQGVYRVLDQEDPYPGVGSDDWIALSVETDAQWRALAGVLGDEALERDEALSRVDGRKDAHDRIDAAISGWARTRTASAAVEALIAACVPAAPVVRQHRLAEIETLVAREFYETTDQPVAGTMRVPKFPIRFSSGPDRWNWRAAPCLGEHNREVLVDVLGLSEDEVQLLETDGVIGNATSVNLGW